MDRVQLAGVVAAAQLARCLQRPDGGQDPGEVRHEVVVVEAHARGFIDDQNVVVLVYHHRCAR